MRKAGNDQDRGGESGARRYTWRSGPLRLVMPWLCIGVGSVMMVKNDSLLLFNVGLGLIVLGIIGFFIARWMAKRGI